MLDSLLQQAVYTYTVAYEEHLAMSLIDEGKRCVDAGHIDEGVKMFLEVNTMHRWRDTLGPLILSNLAFAYALQKNYTLARQYVDDYHLLMGDQASNTEHYQKIIYAYNQINQEETSK